MAWQDDCHEIIKVAAELVKEPSEGQYSMPGIDECELNSANCKKAKRLKKAVDGLRDYIKAMDAAMERSAFDLAPCSVCGEPAVCLPDGMPCCDPCGKKLEDEQ